MLFLFSIIMGSGNPVCKINMNTREIMYLSYW